MNLFSLRSQKKRVRSMASRATFDCIKLKTFHDEVRWVNYAIFHLANEPKRENVETRTFRSELHSETLNFCVNAKKRDVNMMLRKCPMCRMRSISCARKSGAWNILSIPCQALSIDSLASNECKCKFFEMCKTLKIIRQEFQGETQQRVLRSHTPQFS